MSELAKTVWKVRPVLSVKYRARQGIYG